MVPDRWEVLPKPQAVRTGLTGPWAPAMKGRGWAWVQIPAPLLARGSLQHTGLFAHLCSTHPTSWTEGRREPRAQEFLADATVTTLESAPAVNWGLCMATWPWGAGY